MAKKTQAEQRGYLLPETIDPPQVSICICIPCDRNHALAFLGQLNDLGYWWNWERDSEKRGTLAARVWREIYDDVNRQLNECGVFDMSCGCDDKPTLTRWSPEGVWQVYNPDTEEWENRPDLDPRLNTPLLPPPVGTDAENTRCIAAANVRKWMELHRDDIEQLLDAGTTITGLIAALLTFFAIFLAMTGVGVAASFLLMALATAILNAGGTAYAAAMDETTMDIVQCILYCNVGDDGRFTQAQFEAVQHGIVHELDGLSEVIVYDMVRVMGAIGLNNAAASGTEAGDDCGDCDCPDAWCYNFNFVTAGDEDWIVYPESGLGQGVYESGIGWRYTDNLQTIHNPDQARRGVLISRLFASTAITRIRMTYTYEKATGTLAPGATDSSVIYGWNGGAHSMQTRHFSAETNGANRTLEWTGYEVLDRIDVFSRSSVDTVAPYTYAGNVIITSVLVEGLGTNPFGTDNCEE